jgi:hypothetical protein
MFDNQDLDSSHSLGMTKIAPFLDSLNKKMPLLITALITAILFESAYKDLTVNPI